jgi:hypothetical protein
MRVATRRSREAIAKNWVALAKVWVAIARLLDKSGPKPCLVLSFCHPKRNCLQQI